MNRRFIETSKVLNGLDSSCKKYLIAFSLQSRRLRDYHPDAHALDTAHRLSSHNLFKSLRSRSPVIADFAFTEMFALQEDVTEDARLLGTDHARRAGQAVDRCEILGWRGKG